MTKQDLQAATSVSGIHVVSKNTIVVEYDNGTARPVSALELTLWKLLGGMIS